MIYLCRSNHTRWSYHLSKWWDWLEQPELWEALPHTVSMSEAITSSQHKNSLKDHQYYLGSLLCSFPKHLVKYQLPHHQPSPPYLLYVLKSTKKNRCYPARILGIDDPTLIRVNTKQLQIVENHFYIDLILTRSSKDECSTGSNNHLRATDRIQMQSNRNRIWKC